MDPVVPQLEKETRRRRRRPMFSHARIPVRLMVPNFFTSARLVRGADLDPHVDRGPL